MYNSAGPHTQPRCGLRLVREQCLVALPAVIKTFGVHLSREQTLWYSCVLALLGVPQLPAGQRKPKSTVLRSSGPWRCVYQ